MKLLSKTIQNNLVGQERITIGKNNNSCLLASKQGRGTSSTISLD